MDCRAAFTIGLRQILEVLAQHRMQAEEPFIRFQWRGTSREGGELADRAHVPRLQAPRGRRADAPDALDREWMQERELAVGGHDEQAVRLGDAARHLGEELVPGYR